MKHKEEEEETQRSPNRHEAQKALNKPPGTVQPPTPSTKTILKPKHQQDQDRTNKKERQAKKIRKAK